MSIWFVLSRVLALLVATEARQAADCVALKYQPARMFVLAIKL
jgi:hypothetical protein